MAEINYNNLYNQLKPMQKRYYDQQFFKNYVPGQEDIMLSSQPAYEQMKAVYDAQQQVPETSIFDSIFGSASAAEMPQVPNLTYRNIDLPFDLRTGITNTKAALPFKTSVSEILNRYNVPNSGSQDLVNQRLADNQRKTKMIIEDNKVKTVPISYPNVSTAPLRFATDDQTSFFGPTTYSKPNGIIDSTIASNLLYEDLPSGIDTSYGVANEPDVEEDTEEAKKSKSGLGGLFKFLLGLAIPGAGFLMNLPSRGLEGIRSLNQKLRSTDFAQSKTLADYFDAKRYGGRDARDAAAARTMAQARGLQKQIDQRPSAIGGGGGGGGRDMGASVSSPARTSQGVTSAQHSAFRN